MVVVAKRKAWRGRLGRSRLIYCLIRRTHFARRLLHAVCSDRQWRERTQVVFLLWDLLFRLWGPEERKERRTERERERERERAWALAFVYCFCSVGPGCCLGALPTPLPTIHSTEPIRMWVPPGSLGAKGNPTGTDNSAPHRVRNTLLSFSLFLSPLSPLSHSLILRYMV